MTPFEYLPERIIVDRAVLNEPLTQTVLHKFSNRPCEVVERYAWHQDEPSLDPLKNPLTQGKKVLHLKYFAGLPIKPCPGTTEGAICCNYLTLDFIENCPLECTYCILQAFLNKPVITVHANVEEILEQVRHRVQAQPQRLFRVGTGEHSDSLALDALLEINRRVIPFFGQLDNAILELKTKSDQVDPLLTLPHQGKTVVSWSVNPPEVIEQEEHKTARLHERLIAAQKMVGAGYKVAFHMDPLIHYPQWEQGYERLVEALFEAVSPQDIAWISLGALRYIPKLKAVVEERFPKSSIFLGEFIRGEDGKMRYLKKIRQRMFQTVQKKIRATAPGVMTYLCMEKAPIWQQTMPLLPQTDDELDQMIARPFARPQARGCGVKF